MSKEQIAKLRADLAVDRVKTFQTKLAELLEDMAMVEKADEFILLAQQTPEPALA